MALYFGFPIILVAGAAVLGVVTYIFFARGFGHEQIGYAISLAIFIPALAALAYLFSGVSDSNDFKKWYGPFLDWLWLWSLIAFLLGAVLGWGTIRKADGKKK